MQERPGPSDVPPSVDVPVVPLLDVDPTAASDAHLAAAWAARDPLALGEVFRRHAPMLFGFAACLLDDLDAAQDAVHDGLARAASRVGLLDSPSRLPVWLLAIVRAEAAQRVASAPTGRVPRPALGPALWRPDDVLGAPSDPVWSAAAALGDRDREVLELLARGVTDSRDLADVVGVSARDAALLTADMRVRLEAGVGALLVARAGGDGCPELGALLAGRDARWTADLAAVVGRHLQDCADCRSVRSQVTSGVAPLPAGPRHVLLAPDLRARLVRTLGADGSAVAPADRTTSWLVEAVPAGLGGWPWGWLDNGFPGRPPGPVRRVADDVAAVAEVPAGAVDDPVRRRRVPAVAAAVVLGVPLVLGGVVLATRWAPSGAPSASPSAPPVAGSSAGGPSGARAASTAPARSGRPSGAPTEPPSGAPSRQVSGAPTSGSGGGAVAVPVSPGTTVPPSGTFGSSGGTGPGASGTVGPGTPPPPTTSAPEPPLVITSASVGPAELFVPGGSMCKPARTVVTVTLSSGAAVTGSVDWSNGRARQTSALTGTGDTRTASVGPFQVAGTYTLTIRVSGAGGRDSATRSVQVSPCGKR